MTADEYKRLAATEATIASIRTALGGFTDSDLVSLATTLNARNEWLEAEIIALVEELADALADLIACDGDEGRDTTADIARWEAIMGDKWQGR